MIKVTRAVLAEAIFALAFLLLGLFVLYDAFTLEEPGVYSVVSPKTFELIIGFFTTFVALLLIIQVLRGKLGIAEGTEAGAAHRAGWSAPLDPRGLHQPPVARADRVLQRRQHRRGHHPPDQRAFPGPPG